MLVTKNHWLITDEDERFKAAVAGVLLVVDSDTQERIRAELAFMEAITTGGYVGDFNFEPVGLLRIWQEIK